MSRKVKGASTLSLVATLGVTLLGAEGSSAMAQAIPAASAAAAVATTAFSAPQGEIAPTQIDNAAAAPRFVQTPVVQPLPANDEADVSGIARNANSLASLVAEVPAAGKLDEQMQCLAGAIYFESKGEPLAGQLAVGRVVVARATSGRFPSSYCGVVYQRSQFSFVRGGRMPAIDTASIAWKRARKVALIAHEGAWRSAAEGALFFHARYVSPSWKNGKTKLAQIDNHVFYR